MCMNCLAVTNPKKMARNYSKIQLNCKENDVTSLSVKRQRQP